MTTAATPVWDWRALPKASLHEHLDGGLRPSTLIELARARGMRLPHEEPRALAQWMADNANSGSLVRYLEGFALTVQAMATAAACERVARELVQDMRADGCVLGEVRFAPQLFEPWGLAAEAAVEAVLEGLRGGGLPCGLIVCAMRQDPPERTLRAAQVAARYRDQGVVGFDLAGPELGYPPSLHAEALRCAQAAGLALTLHAGEADAGWRVLQAAAYGAQRVGHGVRITDDAAWMEEAKRLGVHFEVCPSSNVHTGAAPSVAEHPVRAMWAAGLHVSISPDNRLMSATTLSDELRLLHEQAGLSVRDLAHMQRCAIEASFLPESSRRTALEQWQVWAQAHGLL